MLPGRPIVGHALDFQRDRTALFQRGYDTLGPVFGLRLFNKPAAVLIGPEYHQVFFTETDRQLSMHKTYSFLRAMFGEIAFTAPPEVYHAQRPILHLPFKGEKMPGYVRIMQQEVQAWLDSLGQAGEFELTTAITALVQNVAAHAFMGRAFRDQMGREFWDQYKVLGQALDPLLPPNLPLPKFIRRDRAKARLRAMLGGLFAERRLHPEAYDDFFQDFVNARYADGQPMPDETIIGLILALMFAGHETTAGQAAWTLIETLRHPDFLALLQAELDTHLPSGAALDLPTLGRLHHAAFAVTETTRMHPSADMLLRLAEVDTDIGTHVIPAGWVVFVTSGLAHRLPELFAAPDEWDPLRFAPGRAEDKQHRFAMIGFGGGVHKCTGMNFANNEMVVIVSLLLQQFDLQLLDRNPTATNSLGASRPTPVRIRYRRRAAGRPSSARVDSPVSGSHEVEPMRV
jgi:sterol 14-demethylase